VNLDNSKCKELMAEFIQRYPEIWNEDIGEEDHKQTEECALSFLFPFSSGCADPPLPQVDPPVERRWSS
jgi:hypothetical protein